MMQSGLGGDDVLEDRTESAMFGILIPVLEKTVILAAKYVKACGRECITEKDFEYALKYCVMYTVGEDIGSIFPEDWDDDDDDTEMIEMSEEEREEDAFTEYDGRDETFCAVNEAVKNFDEWQPSNPVEIMLKNAVYNKLDEQ